MPDADQWQRTLAQALPDATLHRWPCSGVAIDYAIVWKPPRELLGDLSRARAVFNLGAGVDATLASTGASWPGGVPLIRIEDAGMGEQMIEYVVYAVLRWFREFAQYEQSQRNACWSPRGRLEKREFGVGILGMGVLGSSVADAVAKLGFPVAGLSRRSKQLQGMRSFAIDELAAFLASSRVLVCMLPLTPATRGLLDRKAFAMMPRGAYLINVARGPIVVEHDLIDAIDEGSIAGAMLDVFEHEPLAADHAFWHHPRITVTPHIAAVTLLGASVGQIADKIRRIEAGFPVSGAIDPLHAY